MDSVATQITMYSDHGVTRVMLKEVMTYVPCQIVTSTVITGCYNKFELCFLLHYFHNFSYFYQRHNNQLG